MSYAAINKFRTVFRFSRPRFWLYLAGPFIVGSAFGLSVGSFSPLTLFGLFYFLFPVNIFLYGVNDFFDASIDEKNPKKKSYEKSMPKSQRHLYQWSILASVLFSFPLFLFGNQISVTLLFIFFFLAFFYSANPLRFKTKPILDFMSNVLYAFPGFIGYALLTNSYPSFLVFFAAACWTGAMHLFSAVVDIDADRKARIQTSATFFGRQRSLIICSFLWFVSAGVATIISPYLFIGFVYMFFPVLVYTHKVRIEWMYTKFPFINAILGFVLFLQVLSK